MNIKLTKEQAKLVFISISACIREETRDIVIAESEEEFVTMCEEQGYDIHDPGLSIELNRENVRNELGQPCAKYVSCDM